jgi:hypothetical protein
MNDLYAARDICRRVSAEYQAEAKECQGKGENNRARRARWKAFAASLCAQKISEEVLRRNLAAAFERAERDYGSTGA